jgi:hypothetical protein
VGLSVFEDGEVMDLSVCDVSAISCESLYIDMDIDIDMVKTNNGNYKILCRVLIPEIKGKCEI